MYSIEKFEFKSSNEKSTIKVIAYVPKNMEIKGIFQIVHGMCEYIGKYHIFMEFLVNNGYIVFGNDHIGHGKSCENSDEFGFFAKKKGYEFLVEDLYKTKRIIIDKFGERPYYILGHSMGSFITRIYITRYGKNISGVLISGTGNKNKLINIGIILCNIIIFFKGSKYISKFIERISTGNFEKSVENDSTSNNWTTSDKAFSDKYIDDPLCNFKFTVSGYRDLFYLNKEANSDISYINTPKKTPLFIFSGSKDPLGNFSKGVKEVYEKYKENGIEKITLKIYENGRHEMLNEVNKNEVYKDILKWLENN